MHEFENLKLTGSYLEILNSVTLAKILIAQ